MPDIQVRINSVLSITQTVFTLLRDVLLAVFFVFLLCFPDKLNSILTKAGISQVNGILFTWQQQAQQAATQGKAAAQATSVASDSLTNLQSVLQTIASQTTDPNIKKQATDAVNQAAGSITSLDNASSSLAHSVATEQTMLQSAGAETQSSSSPASAGWTYLGEADPTHQHWVNPPQPKIASATPAIAGGQVVTFTDDVFLRADKAQNQTFNQAAILGAVRSDTSATVTALEYSHALKGGDFVWAKVTVKANQ